MHHQAFLSSLAEGLQHENVPGNVARRVRQGGYIAFCGDISFFSNQ